MIRLYQTDIDTSDQGLYFLLFQDVLEHLL